MQEHLGSKSLSTTAAEIARQKIMVSVLRPPASRRMGGWANFTVSVLIGGVSWVVVDTLEIPRNIRLGLVVMGTAESSWPLWHRSHCSPSHRITRITGHT